MPDRAFKHATTQQELPKQYDHAGPEQRWYPFWEERGYFHSEPDPQAQAVHDRHPAAERDRRAAPGARAEQHAARHPHPLEADAGLQHPVDAGHRSRRHRHAGGGRAAAAARKRRRSRHDLGREELVERIWDWKDKYEARILGQLKQLGCSCDWQRTRFTLDDSVRRAVRQTFFSMFKDGLIYRGKRLVNWDTFLQTAVSDDEVFHETVTGHFWHLQVSGDRSASRASRRM